MTNEKKKGKIKGGQGGVIYCKYFYVYIYIY